MNGNSLKPLLCMVLGVTGAGAFDCALAQTIPAAFRFYAINGGSCTGYHASDRSILDARTGALANVGTRNAIVTCHAPLIEGGHVYRVSVYLRYPTFTDSSPFKCTLYTGSSNWGGVLTSYKSDINYNDGRNFELGWGMYDMEIGDINFGSLKNDQYPIQGQPINVQCTLPPKTQLDRFEIQAVQDQPATFNRTP
jgi:hypothetical protein